MSYFAGSLATREFIYSSSLAKTDLDLSIVETPTLIIHIKILYVTLIIIT